jgi:hypothetical protein
MSRRVTRPVRTKKETHHVELWEVGDPGMKVGSIPSIRLCLYIPGTAFLLWSERFWVHTVHKEVNDQFHESSKRWGALVVSKEEYSAIRRISSGVPVGKVAYMSANLFDPERNKSRHLNQGTKRVVRTLLERGLCHSSAIKQRFTHQQQLMQ